MVVGSTVTSLFNVVYPPPARRAPTETPRNAPTHQKSNDEDGTASTFEEGQEETLSPAAALDDGGEANNNEPKVFTYTVPKSVGGAGAGAGAGAGGGTTYVVARTPNEIAAGLLSANNEDEGDGGEENETGSATDEENEEWEEEKEREQQEVADGKEAPAPAPAPPGGKKGKGAPAPSAADIAAAAMANLPRYWRGRFDPLADEDLRELELEKGKEGMEEYLDKRYGTPVVGDG